MKTTIEFKWALIAVLLSSLLTVVLVSENHGGGFVLGKGFQGIGWSKTFDPTLTGYETYVIPLGLIPALGILVWQYVRAQRSKKDDADTNE